MPDYNETTLTGVAWQRCHEVRIDNTRGTLPHVQFFEERVIALEDGAEIRQALGPLTVPFDPVAEIPLLNPVSGEPLDPPQTATYGAAYAIVYSAYLAAAKARDAAIPQPEQPTEPVAPTA